MPRNGSKKVVLVNEDLRYRSEPKSFRDRIANRFSKKRSFLFSKVGFAELKICPDPKMQHICLYSLKKNGSTKFYALKGTMTARSKLTHFSP